MGRGTLRAATGFTDFERWTIGGTLIGGGRLFTCTYAVVFTIDGGMIERIRAYADTRYVSAPFIDV